VKPFPRQVLLALPASPHRLLNARWLQAGGAEQIAEASTVSEALTLLARRSFDLIVSDSDLSTDGSLSLPEFLRETAMHAATPQLVVGARDRTFHPALRIAFLKRPTNENAFLDAVGNAQSLAAATGE
jgi:CheY-like chemotaxis protein